MAHKPSAKFSGDFSAKQPYDKKVAKEKERAQIERRDKLKRLKARRLGLNEPQDDKS
ncbi:MAG: hypothetical protein VW226_13040 [Rhodospirillaceae bacterium]